jgi:hypothetical protein
MSKVKWWLGCICSASRLAQWKTTCSSGVAGRVGAAMMSGVLASSMKMLSASSTMA